MTKICQRATDMDNLNLSFLYISNTTLWKNALIILFTGARVMDHRLRTMALPENLVSITSTPMASPSCLKQ